MLTSTLLLSIVLASPAAAPAASAPATPPAPASAPAADVCDGVTSLDDDAACGDSPLCSRRQRVRLACEVRRALETRYVFWPVKGATLTRPDAAPFEPRAHVDACVAEERSIVREDEPLAFYDRMRRCLAGFEDGHLLFGPPARLPQVALGIGLRVTADGKVHIANRERKLVSYLRTVSGLRDLESILAVGNEVLEIDGRPVADALADMAGYVAGSSEGARRERAVDALTRRDFLFPKRRVAALAVWVNGARRVVEIPWWIAPEAEGHVLTQAYVRRTGIATTDLLAWRYDHAKDAWDKDATPSAGHLRSDTILPARDAAALREYRDEGDRVAVRLGEVVRRRDRAFCYAQILTFHTETLSGPGGARPFAKVLEAFVKECKTKDLDLVLDLRQNGGGYIAHASSIAGMLARADRPAAGGALLLRATTRNQLVFQERSPAVGSAPAREADDAFEPRRVVEAIASAQRDRREYTHAFLERPLRSGEVGGYEGKVVALVSPACMSACDRVAAQLKTSGRAVLVGGPTEGAGGSQQEAKNLPARWTDPDGLLWISIPNAAMGVQRELPLAGKGREPSAEAFFATLAFENRPVEPDLPYATTVEDLREGNRGWLERVDEVLFGADELRAERGPESQGAVEKPAS
jgi:hypothetical protein